MAQHRHVPGLLQALRARSWADAVPAWQPRLDGRARPRAPLLRLSRQPMADRRMRPEPPLTTRLPPLNEIGVIPPTPACRAPSPRPDRQGQELQRRLPRGSPVGPAGTRTELTTD